MFIYNVPHSFIRLASGKLSYITSRIDRINEVKIHMEDMCKLTEQLTEQKYNSSHEQIGNKAIENMLDKFRNSEEQWYEFINISFLPEDLKYSLHDLIKERISRIYDS